MKPTILAVTVALVFLAVAAPAMAQLPQGYESVILSKAKDHDVKIMRANGGVGDFAVPFGKQLIITEIDVGFPDRPNYVGGRFFVLYSPFQPALFVGMIKDIQTNCVMNTGFTVASGLTPVILCWGPPDSELPAGVEPDFFIMRGYLRPKPLTAANQAPLPSSP